MIAKPIFATRVGVITSTVLVTTFASWQYATIVAGGSGTNGFELASIPAFALLFGWITFSFLLAFVGWMRLIRNTPMRNKTCRTDDNAIVDRDALSSTAVLMPVYNESPDRVFAGITAMLRSLAAAGNATTFDFYILSDTTDHEIWLKEEQAWGKLTDAHPEARVFYRHRRKNVARKAGNIADFCSRWGSHYPYMIVLDADSLVEGQTMIELVRRMDSDDQIGILQVPPTPIGRDSLFARVQQFASAAYGRVFVEGFAAWAGSQGNYWGHNAIIRVAPFLQHCDLPILPGKAPLGGEVLSHDFVEAALMLRSGWKVELATDLGGSYEECPPTLADYAIRDNRWCQGNLQHARLAISEGFHPLSRFHFSSGVMAYVASPIWLAFTALCIVGTVIDRMHVTPIESMSKPMIDALGLFVISMAMLLTPKVLALVSITADSELRSRFGGVTRTWIGGFAEMVCSILLSPIMALFHSRFVISTLLGRNIKWSAQQRSEHSVRWTEAIRQFAVFTLVGLIATALTAYAAPQLLIWFSPMLVGLLLSIPLAVVMGSGKMGRRFKRWGMLLIPEEIEPPAILMDRDHAYGIAATESLIDRPSLFETVIHDPEFHLLHRQIESTTGGDGELSVSQSKAIEAAFAEGGPSNIPVEVRSALLADLKTLRALHLESALRSHADLQSQT
ncbi:glucans biosynthesis glucosyltransferase MdoH [Rubripirellula reticaptiva]|uniref:Glucans biosynthesis glucosyltransferase H n=1 Tax=Rubripirellula reticaptiva TaxID=2528013 RepID=A0A5C6EK20_9BACT|nr:glucans biosynthesis glucosyltransferase MdoH [Rubripirellula reticaptiva]TWU47966.1 Glucans biosynthesis glucosyltransferase H [Rubripirellula reticaptiva]